MLLNINVSPPKFIKAFIPLNKKIINALQSHYAAVFMSNSLNFSR